MRKGRNFEQLYEKLYNLDKSKYKVQSPAFLTDRITKGKREVDVLIEYTDQNETPRRISIECRDRGAVQDVTWIEQLIQKKNDLDIDYTIATTTSTFSQPAILKAEAYGIKIETAQKIDENYIDKLTYMSYCEFIFLYTKAMNISFKTSNNKTISKKDFLKYGHREARVGVGSDFFIVSKMEAIEIFLNRELYECITLVDQIKEQTRQEDIFYQPEYLLKFSLKINNNHEVRYICQKIQECIVDFKVIPFKYSVPLSEGLIVDKLENNEINKNILNIYEDKAMNMTFGKIGQNFYLPVKFGNTKDENARFVAVNHRISTSFTMAKGSNISVSIFANEKGSVVENIMGKLDCSELWK